MNERNSLKKTTQVLFIWVGANKLRAKPKRTQICIKPIHTITKNNENKRNNNKRKHENNQKAGNKKKN